MKNIYLKIILVLCCFPALLPAQIQTVQYWFDSDFAGRITQSVTPAATLQISELNTANLSAGLHLANIRAKDNANWSVVHSQLFYKLPLSTQSAEMTGYEYWVDNDFEGKQQGTLSGQTATLNGLNVSSFGEGLHILHIRAWDSLGRSSVAHSQLFYNLNTSGDNEMAAYEYWIDNDFAHRTSQTASGKIATITSLFDNQTISAGIHLVSIRAKDTKGRWSTVHTQCFYRNEVIPGGANKIDAYRYWYDDDFDANELVTLETPVNPYELNTNWTLPAEFKTNETHTFHIQFRDLAGSWSMTAVDTFKITPPVDVESISLNKTTTTILEGGSETLSYIIDPANASNQNVTWSTNNPAVATVTDGTITAISAGTAVITVTTEDGAKTAGCTVTVEILVVPVVSINMNKSETSLLIGSSEMLTYAINPASATNQNVSWKSSNTNVATIENGVVNTVGVGEAVITVTTEDGAKTASCTVTVLPISVESVNLNKSAASLLVGESEILTYNILPANATNKNISWSSSNKDVATVENGVVNAIGVGTAVISVTTEDSAKTASCTITVLPIPVESIDLNKTTASLLIGESETLSYFINPANATNKNISWSSSNEDVATVENCVVNAISVGTAVISVTTEDGNKTASCTVNVEAPVIPVISISLNKSETSLFIGGSEMLVYTVNPASATNQNVSWESSNTSVATIENGVVNAISVGTAVITIITEDGGKTASCTVTVLPIPVESIDLNKTTASLQIGESDTLTYNILPANATNQNITWLTDNPAVATVTNGTITAISTGTAVITVTTEDGAKTASCVVTVIRIPKYNVEYFFDTDPGWGKGTGIEDTDVQLVSETASEKSEMTSFNASIANLNDGLHTLYVRAKNSNGWSQTQNRTFMKASLAADPGLNIKYMEYFIDTDPNYGKGISVDLGENNGVYAFNVDMQPLSDGLHTLYIRARNVDGNWSTVINRTFVKMILPSDLAAGIKAVEYYIDLDPGMGQGIHVPFHADMADINFTADLNTLADGEHTLYLRILNHFNQWEDAGNHTFTLIDPNGIKDINVDELAVYPNPVSDLLYIKNEHYTIQKVEITDMTGHRVYKQNIRESSIISIPVSDYVPGTYILKIYTLSGDIRLLKIIKK